MIIKLLFGLLLVSLVCSSQDFTASIDKIISKHYNIAVENGLVDLENPSGASKHSFTYKCIHDKLQSPNNKHSVGEVVKRIAQKKRDAPVEGVTERSETQKRAPFGAMRFYSNLSFVEDQGSDVRACYTVGQVVKNFNGTDDIDYTCLDEDILSTNLASFIRTSVIPALLEVFSTVINVQVTQGNLKLNEDYYNESPFCGEDLPIPPSYVTEGLPNTDYVVFVTSRPSDDKGTVAYAGMCNAELALPDSIGRPLAGQINFIPRYFQEFASGSYSEFEFNNALKTAIHELTHALGFSGFYYRFYKDLSTGDYYPQNIKVTDFISGVNPSGVSYNKFVPKLRPPRALDYAREHFSCPTLLGIELEDFGGSGTAGSHWERRVAGDEYMVGFVNPAQPISGLTLSLFEDMGWYTVNFDKAEFWGWGKGAGCDFLDLPCEQSWPAAGYWCNPGASGCSPDRTAKGVCTVDTYPEDLPIYYQRFVDPKMGGFKDFDCCPYITARREGYYCTDPSYANQSDSTIGEEIGKANSLCFDAMKGDTNVSSCYQYKCLSESQLQIYVSGTWLDCPVEGGSVNASSIVPDLSVTCPSTDYICGRYVPKFEVNTNYPSSTIVTPTGDTEDQDGSSSSASVINVMATLSVLFSSLLSYL